MIHEARLWGGPMDGAIVAIREPELTIRAMQSPPLMSTTNVGTLLPRTLIYALVREGDMGCREDGTVTNAPMSLVYRYVPTANNKEDSHVE